VVFLERESIVSACCTTYFFCPQISFVPNINKMLILNAKYLNFRAKKAKNLENGHFGQK